MANYQNGQSYYQHPNHPSQSAQSQYGGYAHQQSYAEQALQRTSSFNAGDDADLVEGQQGQDLGVYQTSAPAGGGYTSYARPNNLGSQRGQTPSTAHTNSLPDRSLSYRGGHQPDLQPAVTSPVQSYNPSQYPQTPSTYNPQAYGSSQSPFSPANRRPYNPAAYQDPNLQRQASQSYRQNSIYSTPTAPTSQPPPPPPRPGERSYAQTPTAYNHYPQESQYSQPYGQQSSASGTLPTRTASHVTSPPAPPLHDYYAAATSTAAPRPYSHAPSYADHDSDPAVSQSPYGSHNAPSYYPPPDDRRLSHTSGASNRSDSQVPSPLHSAPSPQGWQSSQASPRRNDTLSRHPQARPLPGPPSESESDTEYLGQQNGAQFSSSHTQDESAYDDLMREVDAAITEGRQGASSSGRSAQTRRHDHYPSTQDEYGRDLLFPTISPPAVISPDDRPTHLNGNVMQGGQHNVNDEGLDDESDAEAAAGLAAMRAAEEQEAAEEARRRSGSASLFSGLGSQRQSRIQSSSTPDMSSDSDYANVDMGLVGGGYEGQMQYGRDPQSDYADAAASMPHADQFGRTNPKMNSFRSSGRSSDERESQTSGYESIPAQDAIHPFPPFRQPDVARVDTGGTGGLTEPSPHPRRLSFEDGDEVTLAGSEMGQTSASVSPSKESMPDLFYHPGMTLQRPLPPAPSASDPGGRLPLFTPSGSHGSYNRSSQYDHYARPFPSAPEAYQQSLLSPSIVPRSTSLSSNRSVPRADHPMRSKTDADAARLHKQQMAGRPVSDMYDSMPQNVTLDLPSIPRKKFNPSKLSNEQLKNCSEPWALSSIVAWIKDLADEETDLREHAVVEAIVNLFTNKVPTMMTADAETLGARVVKEMFRSGALVKDEEWVKFGLGNISGVLFQLTGTGCYSPKIHLYSSKGRCYSHHCMRTLKKVDLSLTVDDESEDWATYYKLKREDLETHPKKEVERQNVLHEIVTSEISFISHLDILRVLYRDQLAACQPPIIHAKKLPGFIKDVFGKIDVVKKVNEEYLLAQLKYRQNEQGPYIIGFSDIFREWIRKAKSVYVDYAAGYPRADRLVRREAEKNILFKQFLDQARDDKRSNRLSWDTYLKDPITRLQRYGLLLSTVLKNMPKDSEEKLNLQFAIDEIRAATFECNAKVAEMEKKMELIDLGNRLILRKGMEKEVELNLDHLGREILIRGDLQRAGGKGFQWVDTHAILFDHYLVLAKTIVNRDSAGGKRSDMYDVSKVPIPMDLIVLESTNDDPVVKSSVKVMGAVTTSVTTTRGPTGSAPGLPRNPTFNSMPNTLSHTTTSGSIGSKETVGSSGRTMVTTTVLEPSSKDEKIMYPFRVKHLGKSEVYTLYAPSSSNRQEWCEAIIQAKTNHAKSLFAQNAEPFHLNVLADTAFAYDSIATISKRVFIEGTPLDRAIKEAEQKYQGEPRPGPVCRAAVNCATVFNQPHGRLRCAVGTDFGVFISEYENPRGWTRAIQMPRVTQVAVFEEFNLFLLISDKSLIAYHLDAVCPVSGPVAPTGNDSSSRRAPQKLSGAKDVGFFATGRMKDRALVFYKKREGLSSTFKVLEPVLQRSSTTRSRFLPTSSRRGQTEFFREYDEFYIPTDCYSINLFHSSLAISTARGVEVLTLDKKHPWSVPNLRSEQPDAQAHLSSIASRIKDLRPLGMFRLAESEFLVAFEECAVYVNKHGEVSRGVVMEFVGRAKSACLSGQYLILFNDDFVEIRNALNGRMKQVIAGKDIKMLDDGGESSTGSPTSATAGLGGGLNGLGLQGFHAAPRTVKISMQHPEHERNQIVVELVENKGQKE